MKTVSEQITPFQYMFSFACFIQSSSMLTSFLVPVVRQDSWLVVLAGMVISIPVLLIFWGIMKSFPGKTLIEIFFTVFGRVGGALFSAVFTWFLITSTSLNLSDLGTFLRQTVLVETPVIATTSLCLALCAYVVYKGFNVVTRYAPAFAFLSLFFTILSILLTVSVMKADHFLPMMTAPPIRYVQSVNIISTIPFGEVVVFLMVTPYVRVGKKSLFAYILGGFLFGSSLILAVVARDTAVLGNTIGLFSLPPYETLRMASIGNALNRIEILFSVVLVVMKFFKLAFLLYVSVLACAQLFGLKSYRPLILTVGALIVAYSMFVYPSSMLHISSTHENEPIFWLIFNHLIPLITLIVARARRLHKNKTPQPQEEMSPL